MSVKISTDNLELLAPAFKGQFCFGSNTRPYFASLDDLFLDHFLSIGAPDHPCRSTLHRALSELNLQAAQIVETGSAAWGTKSTLLFDSYVNSFGGLVRSADIRFEPMFTLSQLCTQRTALYCNDSLVTLREIARETRKIDLVYLDSWDVDIADPLPSAIHGFKEFMIILPILKKYGGLLLIDDTPLNFETWHDVHHSSSESFFSSFIESYGFTPGKGGLVKDYLLSQSIGTLVDHRYQLLWKF